jgi:hypothetical protein
MAPAVKIGIVTGAATPQIRLGAVNSFEMSELWVPKNPVREMFG